MPHQLAYIDPDVYQVDVVLKNKTADGKRERQIAAYIKRRVEEIILRSQKRHPYYNAIEAVRRFLLGQINQMGQDQIDVLALRVMIRGKAGVGGNSIGVDIRMP